MLPGSIQLESSIRRPTNALPVRDAVVAEYWCQWLADDKFCIASAARPRNRPRLYLEQKSIFSVRLPELGEKMTIRILHSPV
jgi:hypothetical protein